jgi:hypothetical protein
MARREFKVKWVEIDAEAKPQEKRQAHIMAMLREQLDAGGFKLSHTEPDGTSVYYAGEAQ